MAKKMLPALVWNGLVHF